MKIHKHLAITLMILVVAVALFVYVADYYDPTPPLDSMPHHANSIWTTTDGEYAFVVDSGAYCFGLSAEEEEILTLEIDSYSEELSGHSFLIYSTEELRLEDAFRTSNNREAAFELLYEWSAMPGESNTIEVKTDGGETVCFEKHELMEEFFFSDALQWPPEMLQWMEQRELSK